MLNQKDLQFIATIFSRPNTAFQGLAEAAFATALAHKIELMFNELNKPAPVSEVAESSTDNG